MQFIFMALFLCLAACTSPEADRSRGGGPGADVGNRDAVVEMHEGSKPYWETPQLIAVKQDDNDSSRETNQRSQ